MKLSLLVSAATLLFASATTAVPAVPVTQPSSDQEHCVVMEIAFTELKDPFRLVLKTDEELKTVFATTPKTTYLTFSQDKGNTYGEPAQSWTPITKPGIPPQNYNLSLKNSSISFGSGKDSAVAFIVPPKPTERRRYQELKFKPGVAKGSIAKFWGGYGCEGKQTWIEIRSDSGGMFFPCFYFSILS
jgi:hypothetical protein